MKHEYLVISRKTGAPILLDEKAISQLIYSGDIEFDRTGHVGKDQSMTHYFKFKE